MLSVLIPVYNYDVNSLVKTLDQQLTAAGIPYEIILADDCSEASFCQKNASLSCSSIQYLQNHSNMGRARIRNYMADIAKYPYLLFIDCDATVQHKNYIQRYLDAIETMRQENYFIINGGVAYKSEKPDRQYYLRWFYGKRREEVKAEKRAQNVYHHFTPFNVLLTKTIFERLKFDERLTQYGHEDTLFGYQLKEHGIPYLHIDNELIHEGLDSNEEFLSKIRTAIDNISYLSEDQYIYNQIIRENRLLKTYNLSKRIGMPAILAFIFRKYHTRIEKWLCRRPNMVLLDLYKLSYLASKKQK